MRLAVRVLVVGLLAAVLSGCATIRISLKFLEDGTAEMEQAFAFEPALLGLMATSGQDPIKEAEKKAQQDGSTFQRWESGGRVGYKVTQSTSKTAVVADTLRQPIDTITVREALFWRDYGINLDVDLSEDLPKDQMASAMLSTVDFKFSVEVPTGVDQHNGELGESGRRVTWTLVPGVNSKLHMRARQFLWGRIAIAAGGSALLMGAVGVVLYRTLRAARIPLPTSPVAPPVSGVR